MKYLSFLCWFTLVLPVWAVAGTIANQQNSASTIIDQPVINANNPNNLVDEAILWALLRAQKFTELKQQIKQLQQRFPAWQPPADLVLAMRDANKANPSNNNPSNSPDERILWRLFHAKQYTQLTEQANHRRQQYPNWLPPKDLTKAMLNLKRRMGSTGKTEWLPTGNPDPCPNLPSKWSRAEAHLKNHQVTEALVIYQQIIVQCPTANKTQTLEKAVSRLKYPTFKPLLAVSRPYLPSLYLDYLKFHALKNRLLDHKPLNLEQHKSAVSEINSLIGIFKDDDLAAVIGWRYVDLKAYRLGQGWFQKAVLWQPGNENAQYGQVLSLQKAGDDERALAVFSTLKNPSSQTKAIAANIYKAKAWQNLDHRQLNAAAENTLQAQKIAGLDPEIQTLNAWIAKQKGEYASAAKWFEGLYQQSPSQQYARAYIQSQAQVDRGVLAEKAEQSQGILLDEYRQFHGTELYQRKQFQSAFKLSPNSFPLLQAIDSPFVDLGGYARYKSGENGLGRLDLFKAPVVSGAYAINGDNTFKLSFSRIDLYAGSPSKCQSAIGSLTLGNSTSCSASTAFAPPNNCMTHLKLIFLIANPAGLAPLSR